MKGAGDTEGCAIRKPVIVSHQSLLCSHGILAWCREGTITIRTVLGWRIGHDVIQADMTVIYRIPIAQTPSQNQFGNTVNQSWMFLLSHLRTMGLLKYTKAAGIQQTRNSLVPLSS